MLLAGDVGGTNTRLGLFDRGARRPDAVSIRTYPTRAFGSFGAILDRFIDTLPSGTTLQAAAVGIAGPVVGDRARLTNGAWEISVAEIAARVEGGNAVLMNDLECMALGIPALEATELATLQRGTPGAGGNQVVVAAGTGLGQAVLHRVDGRVVPVASEGGHADFAARTDREFDLVRMLRGLHGRAEVEQVLSGRGLENLHRFTHAGQPCPAVPVSGSHDIPAAITGSALAGTCPDCVAALGMFVDALGSEAGNLALRAVATGGVFIGGGIPPKILPALQDGVFLTAFLNKPPMTALLSTMPVHVIIYSETGLLGAAVAAQDRA